MVGWSGGDMMVRGVVGRHQTATRVVWMMVVRVGKVVGMVLLYRIEVYVFIVYENCQPYIKDYFIHDLSTYIMIHKKGYDLCT